MAELPDLPENWTDGASAAYLLLGLAIIDGVLHDEETDRVYERLSQHVGGDAAILRSSVEMSWGHLQEVFQSGGMDGYLDSLQAHCVALRSTYPKATIRALVDDLVNIAQADGEVASAEIAYIAAVTEHLGVELLQPGT